MGDPSKCLCRDNFPMSFTKAIQGASVQSSPPSPVRSHPPPIPAGASWCPDLGGRSPEKAGFLLEKTLSFMGIEWFLGLIMTYIALWA